MSNSDEINIVVFDREQQEHQFNIPQGMGLNLMEVCKANQLPVEGICGGLALCGSCHVYVLSEIGTSDINDAEEMMLDQLPGTKSNSRLACQIKLDEINDLIIVKLAPLS